jgi:biotin synthase-like enzyme
MSSPARRREREAQYEAEQLAAARERERRAARSMWEKIEDARDMSDVREILHEIAEKLGLE